jgi:hypothetical protein
LAAIGAKAPVVAKRSWLVAANIASAIFSNAPSFPSAMLRDTVNRTIWLAVFNDSFFQTMTPKIIWPQKVSRFLKAATDEGQPSDNP